MSATLPKLVRDRIPEKITDGGNTPAWHTAMSLDEHTQLLHDKINEEFLEFVERPSLEEAADCLEVLRALFSLHGYSIEEALDAADLKADDCGGFYYGIILGAISAGTP